MVNKVGNGKKRKISGRLERKLAINDNNNPHITIKDMVQELASSGKM